MLATSENRTHDLRITSATLPAPLLEPALSLMLSLRLLLTLWPYPRTFCCRNYSMDHYEV